MALDSGKTELSTARDEAAVALYRQITEQISEYNHPDATRALAEAFALVRGSFTGGPKVDVKS